MSTEEQHVALPKLYGAPAYARPPRSEDPKPRPFDPDDLPIVVHQSDEERDLFDRSAVFAGDFDVVTTYRGSRHGRVGVDTG